MRKRRLLTMVARIILAIIVLGLLTIIISMRPSHAVDRYELKADQPTPMERNLALKHRDLMIRTAESWSKFITWLPSDYGRNNLSRQEEARLIFEWLGGYTEMDYASLHDFKLIGNEWLLIDTMRFSEMSKHIREYDPYSVICRGSQSWIKEQRAAFTPLEFAIAYALLLDSRGIVADVVVGEIDNERSLEIYKPDADGYVPPYYACKIDFRVRVWLSDKDWIMVNPRQAMVTGNARQYFDVPSRDDWGWKEFYILPKMY